MTKQVLNDAVPFGEQRTKINSNFTELYDAVAERLPEVANYAAVRALTDSSLTAVYVKGVTSALDGGSGIFRVKAGDSTSVDNAATILVDTLGRRWFREYNNSISPLWFGADNTGTYDNTAAFSAVVAFLNSQQNPPECIFPSGHYKYSSSPNWAIQDATYTANGSVFLECTGSGHAVILNGQATANGNIYNCKFGSDTPFIIAAKPTGGHGIYASSFHHSIVSARVIGAGNLKAGMYVQFAVCSRFNIQVTKNGQPANAWYNSAQPTYGIYLTELNPGELVSYCTFINPILEHVASSGAYLDHAFGSTFVGGTMEGCGSVGLQLTSNAFNNRFYDVDFEVNTDHDIYCTGRENQFINCDTNLKITIDGYANNNVIDGGSHNAIYISANCANTKLIDFVYNRNDNGSTINDLSYGKTYYRGLTNRVTNSTRNTPLEFTSITLTASPFIFENITQNEVDIIVAGGTVSDISFIRPDGLGFISLGSSTGMIRLSRGDKVQITYSVAPVVKLISR